MTNENSNKFPVLLIKEALTTIAGFSVLSYVFGFLIINAFLISHGFVAYTLPNTEYLSAGICYMFFCAFAGVLFARMSGDVSPTDEWDLMVSKRRKALKDKLDALSQKHKARSMFGYRVAFPIGFGIGYFIGYVIRVVILRGYYLVLLLFLLPLFYIMTPKITPTIFFVMFPWTITIALTSGLVIDLWKKNISENFSFILLLLVFAVLSAILYGGWLYPNISPSIGGGMPLEAVFVVSEDGKNAVETTLGIELNDEKTPPVKVLLETSESFVVIVEHNNTDRVCQIKKDFVNGVIHRTTE